MQAQALPQFALGPRGPISQAALRQGLADFHSLCHWVRDLPYGRVSQPERPELAFAERRSTCGTKHQILALAARENGRDDIRLMCGIYAMDARNTPQIGDCLREGGLEYMPEAHNYLRHGGKVFDFTRPSSTDGFLAVLLDEVEVPEAGQLPAFKRSYHRAFLESWRGRQPWSARHGLEELWSFREQCIANMSRPQSGRE